MGRTGRRRGPSGNTRQRSRHGRPSALRTPATSFCSRPHRTLATMRRSPGCPAWGRSSATTGRRRQAEVFDRSHTPTLESNSSVRCTSESWSIERTSGRAPQPAGRRPTRRVASSYAVRRGAARPRAATTRLAPSPTTSSGARSSLWFETQPQTTSCGFECSTLPSGAARS